jgi:hypothetical protein
MVEPPGSLGRQQVGDGAGEAGQVVAAVDGVSVGQDQWRRVWGVDGEGAGVDVDDPGCPTAGVEVLADLLGDFGESVAVG